ncbi:hypothetical protein HPB47_021385 [Ixodes persulcatus]|uniref:Uncharacterized protein n=1 Tax=Ixodes persulcatus TaxID=34615 RepID=A0AC60QCN2_IXOPE|nr:hypothetical protein HPB47_021385 [Ixodes persulcatus]
MHLHFERTCSSRTDCAVLSLTWMGKVPDELPEEDGWRLNRVNYYQDGWLASGNARGIVGVTFTTCHCRKTAEHPVRTNYNLRGHRSEMARLVDALVWYFANPPDQELKKASDSHRQVSASSKTLSRRMGALTSYSALVQLEGVQHVVRDYFRSAGLAKYASLHPPRSIKCCVVGDSNQVACQEWSQSIFCLRSLEERDSPTIYRTKDLVRKQFHGSRDESPVMRFPIAMDRSGANGVQKSDGEGLQVVEREISLHVLRAGVR